MVMGDISYKINFKKKKKEKEWIIVGKLQNNPTAIKSSQDIWYNFTIFS